MHPAPPTTPGTGPFDLKAIRNAVPERCSSTTPRAHRRSITIPPIELLPNEILGEIFDILLAMACQSQACKSGSRRGTRAEEGSWRSGKEMVMVRDSKSKQDPLKLPLALSSVSRKFHQATLTHSSFWTKVHITLSRARSPSIISSLLARSSKRPIELSLRFPSNPALVYTTSDERAFEQSWRILGEHTAGYGVLDLEAPNNVLHEISRHLSDKPMPLLTTISISQPRDGGPLGPPAYFGTFCPSHDMLRSISINHAGIRLHDSTCLINVDTFILNNSFGPLLDQRGYTNLNQRFGVPVPSTMRSLHTLHISNMPIGIPETTNPSRKKLKNPFMPLFTRRCLRNLVISGIEEKRMNVVLMLFVACYTPLLETLKLERLSHDVWLQFMHFLRSTVVLPLPAKQEQEPHPDSDSDSRSPTPTPTPTPTPSPTITQQSLPQSTPSTTTPTTPTFPSVHTLTLSALPTRSLTPFFFRAFPNLRVLILEDGEGPAENGAGDAYHLMRDESLCRGLEVIVLGGRRVERPSAVLMITAG